MQRDLGGGGIDLTEIVRREFDWDGRDVLFQAMQLATLPCLIGSFTAPARSFMANPPDDHRMFNVEVVAILRLCARWDVCIACGDCYGNQGHRRRCCRLGRICQNLSVTPACKRLPGRRLLSGQRDNRARSMLSTPAAISTVRVGAVAAVAAVLVVCTSR